MRRVCALVLVMVGTLGLVAAPAGAKLSKACSAALAKADRLSDAFSEYIVNDIEGFGTDDAALHHQGREFGLQAAALRLQDQYAAAAKKCRK